MKQISIVLALTLLLASCSMPKLPFTKNNTDGSSTGAVSQTENKDYAIKEGDSVSLNYVGKFEDGTVFDTSIASVAKEAGKFNEGRTYEPLTFVAKEGGGVITGMWKGVIGMKVGEKKTLTIAPKDAYGEKEEIQESILSKSVFDATFTRTIPRSETEDVIRTTVDKNLLGTGADIAVGKVITAGDGTKATIEAITSTGVTLAIDNSKNPFHGKKIAVGTEVTVGKNPAKITKVTKDDITLLITNKDNPFAGKKLSVGQTAEYQGRKLRISKLDGDNVTIQVTGENTNPMAGKTLVFDVEITAVNPAK